MSTHEYRDYRDPPNTIFTLGILAALLMILAGLWLIQYPPLVQLVEQIQIRSYQPLLPEITQQVERRTIIITATPNPETAFLPPPTGAPPTLIPIDTPIPLPTDTSAPLPIDTPVPLPTDTSVPLPTDTSVPLPTDTSVPLPTDTSVPLPTDTSVPLPTDPSVPLPTDTPVPLPTDTPVPLPTDTRLPTPTSTPVPFAPPEPTATWVEVNLLEGDPEFPQASNGVQSLHGTIRFFDDGGNLDLFGRVILIDAEGVEVSKWVDHEGNFSIPNVPDGSYSLQAEKYGVKHTCLDNLILQDNPSEVTLPTFHLTRMGCK